MTTKLTAEVLLALLDEVLPELDPVVERSRPMFGDDPAADARLDERSTVEYFIIEMQAKGLLQPSSDDEFEVGSPVPVLKDQIDMPDFNPITNNNRGEWSLRDVSSGDVRPHPRNVVSCVDHGAMNSVSPNRDFWRCLACGRAAFRVLDPKES